MTSKERLKIRLAIFKTNLKITYHKFLMKIIMLKMIINLIKIKLLPIRMRLRKLRFALIPLKVIFFMPGYIALGLLAILAVLINRNNYGEFISLSISMMNPQTLTDEQKQYIDKWLDLSHHLSFWFWIALLILLS